MSAALEPGTSFGGYRIETPIGRGGMGVVYRAFDPSLERPVALKLVAPELADDERFRRRFLREPKLAAALDHPNVIPIYEAGERDGQLYLAMRYVEGSDLRTVLAAGPLARERALDILAQVASALDAAHRRELVHRDVKPANVLLDEDAHAYLTDFGVTKRAGGDTTEAGLVGTLDYLAPELIRGGAVDGRSDEYALACVLYECLAGAPPFRRDTDAETMWAHLHDDPPPLSPALDAVLRRGLAKDKDDRYATCGELIAAARTALAPGAKAPRRRPRALVAAAGLLLLAAAALAALEETRGDAPSAPTGSGVAVLAPGDGHIAALVESATAPSNIAIGEGGIWALNAQDDTVTRIDPRSKAVTGRFAAPWLPKELAAGAGAVWIGDGSSVARVDPRTLRVTSTVKLPNPRHGEGLFHWGLPQLAVGAGAVWARDPDGTIARIDPRSGRVVGRVAADADRVVAGDAGVWVLSGHTVARIDPATNRLGRRTQIGASGTLGIAVGGGAVWVAANQEGLLWRIDPGPVTVTRSIPVGTGIAFVAYGAGAVWVGNLSDGVVSRVDPRTDRVTARTPVGAGFALAAGEGAAWVSTAGATAAGTLPAEACGRVMSGGHDPDLLIASDLPLRGEHGDAANAMVDAIGLVLAQHRYRAGRFVVGYQSCDESTAQSGDLDIRRCAGNANAYAHDQQLVAVIGPFYSDCASYELATLNRAPGGSVPVISPTASYAGLTRANSLPPGFGGFRGEPGVYYPTGVRNFVRLPTGDDLQAAALAALARQLRLARVYALSEGDTFWKDLLTDPFKGAARTLGLGIAGESAFDAHTRFAALARAVARSGADGVIIGGWADRETGSLIKALRAQLGPRATLLGGFGLYPPDAWKMAGPAARGLYVSSTDTPRGVLPLTAAGKRVAAALGKPQQGVLEAAQAAELVLSAIARSDGTRASVLKQLRASRVRDGILGSFHFDSRGDIDPETVPILRVTGRRGGPIRDGAVDRVITIPDSLRG